MPSPIAPSAAPRAAGDGHRLGFAVAPVHQQRHLARLSAAAAVPCAPGDAGRRGSERRASFTPSPIIAAACASSSRTATIPSSGAQPAHRARRLGPSAMTKAATAWPPTASQATGDPAPAIAASAPQSAGEAMPRACAAETGWVCPGGKERMRRLMATIEGGRVDLKPPVTHRFRLGQIEEAYDLFNLQRDGVRKVALTP